MSHLDEPESLWRGPYSLNRANELHELTARIDPGHAKLSREFWESRTANQLRVLRDQAWNCADGTQWMLANCYIPTMLESAQ